MSDDRELDPEKTEQNDAPKAALPLGAAMSVLVWIEDEPEPASPA
jgi:hypothetical protein